MSMTPPSISSCPNCQNDLFVRFEHVITGTRFTRLFYCGACDCEWNELQPVQAPKPKLPTKPYAKPKPDRRRQRR